MKWFCMVMALVVGLAAGWVQAQEKNKGESRAELEKKMKEVLTEFDSVYVAE